MDGRYAGSDFEAAGGCAGDLVDLADTSLALMPLGLYDVRENLGVLYVRVFGFSSPLRLASAGSWGVLLALAPTLGSWGVLATCHGMIFVDPWWVMHQQCNPDMTEI